MRPNLHPPLTLKSQQSTGKEAIGTCQQQRDWKRPLVDERIEETFGRNKKLETFKWIKQNENGEEAPRLAGSVDASECGRCGKLEFLVRGEAAVPELSLPLLSLPSFLFEADN